MTSQRFGGEGNKDPASSPSSDSEDICFINEVGVTRYYVHRIHEEELVTSPDESINNSRCDSSALQETKSEQVIRFQNLGDFEAAHSSTGSGQEAQETGTFQLADVNNDVLKNQYIEVFHEGLTQDVSESFKNESELVTVSSTSLDQRQENICEWSKDKNKFRRSTCQDKEKKSQMLYPFSNENRSSPEYKNEDSVQSIFLKCSPKPVVTSDDKEVEFSKDSLNISAHEIKSSVHLNLKEVKKDEFFSKSHEQSSYVRLRPPLVATVGASADSGTGDCGSAEIQTETFPSFQPLSSERLSVLNTDNKTSGIKNSKQIVKPFTKESLGRVENRSVQLVRDYGFQPRRKTSVEDGSVLPKKFEPFPAKLYGRPLEEIDNFIYDEV